VVILKYRYKRSECCLIAYVCYNPRPIAIRSLLLSASPFVGFLAFWGKFMLSIWSLLRLIWSLLTVFLIVVDYWLVLRLMQAHVFDLIVTAPDLRHFLPSFNRCWLLARFAFDASSCFRFEFYVGHYQMGWT